MTAPVQWMGVAACLLVLAGCICRVDLMRGGRHKAGWLLLYLLWGPFAGGVAIDLVRDRDVDWWTCWGIAGVLVHLVLTRRLWRHGPPHETTKGT